MQDYTIEYWLRVDGEEVRGTLTATSESQSRAMDYVKAVVAEEHGVSKSRVQVKIKWVR